MPSRGIMYTKSNAWHETCLSQITSYISKISEAIASAEAKLFDAGIFKSENRTSETPLRYDSQIPPSPMGSKSRRTQATGASKNRQ